MLTYLVAVVICVLVMRGIIFVIPKLRSNNGINWNFDKTTWATYLASFVSGGLFTNAVPHFIHSVSGEYFPAPFGKF